MNNSGTSGPRGRAGTVLAFAAMLISGGSVAGIETPLFEQTYRGCTVRIVHDATPDSRSATLVFRVYQVVDGVHRRCPINDADAADSLSRALKRYSDHDGLKPLTSLMIGRLINYPWAAEYLQRHAEEAALQRPSQKAFNERVMESPIVEPFVAALIRHGFSVPRASCEKILLDDNGAPTDALCWLVIESEAAD